MPRHTHTSGGTPSSQATPPVRPAGGVVYRRRRQRQHRHNERLEKIYLPDLHSTRGRPSAPRAGHGVAAMNAAVPPLDHELKKRKMKKRRNDAGEGSRPTQTTNRVGPRRANCAADTTTSAWGTAEALPDACAILRCHTRPRLRAGAAPVQSRCAGESSAPIHSHARTGGRRSVGRHMHGGIPQSVCVRVRTAPLACHQRSRVVPATTLPKRGPAPTRGATCGALPYTAQEGYA